MKTKFLVWISAFILAIIISRNYLIQDQKQYFSQLLTTGCCAMSDNAFSNLNIIKRKINENLYVLFSPDTWFKKFTQPEYIFLLSKTDKSYFDSITKIAVKNGNIADDIKKYRNTSLIYNDTSYNVKVKLRGSDPTTHFWGVHSIKVNSDIEINNRQTFNIISGLEYDYRNIFFNIIADQFNLYTQETGEIITYSFNKRLHDGFLYSEFDFEYVLNRYSDTLYNIFKNFKNIGSHTSEFDNLYYNNEKKIYKDLGYKLGITKNKKFKSGSFKFNNFEQDYFASFISLLYLFGDAHQITGDNLEMLHINRNFIPLFRKESYIAKLNINRDKFDSSIFLTNEQVSSHLNFKKLLIDDEFRNMRNKKLKILLTKRKEISSLFDSVYYANMNKHSISNSRYFDQKIAYSLMSSNLKNNIEKIEDYFKTGKTFYSLEDDTLKIVSDTYVQLKYKINDFITYTHQPRNIYIENGELKSKFNEKKIIIKEKINSLKVINTFSNDTISYKFINESD